MKSKIQIIFTVLLLSFTLASTTQAFQLVNCGTQSQSGQKDLSPTTEQSNQCELPDLIYGVISIVNFLIGSASLLAIGFIVYGGVRMILARGNPAGIDDARKTIVNAITGLIIVFMAYIIVSYILTVLTGGTFTFKNVVGTKDHPGILDSLPIFGK